MPSAIIFDTEFLTAEGALSRLWFGPDDPDPVVVQAGLVRLSLEGDFAVQETLRLHVIPRDRHGLRMPLDPYFTALTGVAEADLARDGLPLDAALARVAAFADGARLWSWGKDEFYLMAIGCYIEGIAPPLPAHRFANARRLFRRAGMSDEVMARTASNGLAAHYGLGAGARRAHDALDDALSIAEALQHLLRQGALVPADFD